MRRVSKMIFERIREMREILEPHFDKHIDRFTLLFFYFIMGQLQPSFRQPFLRGSVEGFFKIPSESGYAASREIAEFIHGHIEHVMTLHKVREVDLAWIVEI